MERAALVRTSGVNPSVSVSSEMKNKVALRRIESFRRRFQEPHLYLAYHAAFPVALTPDLLYSLWANFRRDINGQFLEIPWIAVADLLLSNLCNEVGYELYEMDKDVRRELIRQLKRNENRFGQQRIHELAQFLLDYVKQQIRSDDPYIRDSAKVQHLTALAYTQPPVALSELALMLAEATSGATSKDSLEQIYSASLVEEFEESLGDLKDFKQLQHYARAIEKYARGDLGQAGEQFRILMGQKKQISVAGVVLSIPLQLQLFEKGALHQSSADWHTLSPEQVLNKLASNSQAGLNSQEAVSRLMQVGGNELEVSGRSAWKILLEQFTSNIMLKMLIVAAIVSSILGSFDYTLGILVIVIVNGLLGYILERKAEKDLTVLKRMLASEAHVIRNGRKIQVNARELVPGDIMLLEAGSQIPADGRLLDVANLKVQETDLTGEDQGISKVADVELPEDTPIGDRINLVFMGTDVIEGRGTAVVTTTGVETVLGGISEILQSVEAEPTLLQRRLDQLIPRLVVASVSLAAILFLLGLLRQFALDDIFFTCVSLIVSVMPVELPLVITVILALGSQRMTRQHALIRKLPAIETLGSVTIICSESTGILTQNEITVQEIFSGGNLFIVTGIGYGPEGAFLQGEQEIDPTLKPALMDCLVAGLLCNDSQLRQGAEGWHVEGDPMDGGLITVAKKAKLEPRTLKQKLPRINAISFDVHSQNLATLHQRQPGQGRLMYVKGSLESILPRCAYSIDAFGNEAALNRDTIHQAAEEMTQKGLRVLAFAQLELPHDTSDISYDTIERLVFLGLQGMTDSAREEAIQAVRACQGAGIKIKMITNDHISTAAVTARQIGLTGTQSTYGKALAISGKEIEELSDYDLVLFAERTPVFADVTPEQKLRLVKALQSRGHIIAMTGSSVEDSLALRQADIGIAMGTTGTDVCKEAADIVLTDDRFTTIETAVEEGRHVYENITKFIVWTLPTNGSLGLTILVAMFFVVPPPLLPLQILWIHTTTVIFLGTALAFEVKEPGLMKRPPRPSRTPLLKKASVQRILWVSAFLCITAFAVFNLEAAQGEEFNSARTAAVNAIVFGEISFLFACRSLRYSASELGCFSNHILWVGVILTVMAQLLFTYVPAMNAFLGTVPMGLDEWALILGASLLLYLLVELEKWVRRLYVVRH